MKTESLTDMHDHTIEEIEQAVVCALLVQPQTLPEVAGWLRPDMFQTPAMEFIYTAILTQYDRGEAPDFLTTETEMRHINSQKHADIGGLSSLGDLLHRVRSTDNLPRYAAEVKRHYLLRQLRAVGTWAAEKATFIETEPLQLLEELENRLLGIRQSVLDGDSLRNLTEHIRENLEEHTRRIGHKPSEYSVCSGFRELDEMTGGWQPGELVILGGRPGDGKTAIALQMASNAALAGKKTAFFSLEMDSHPVVNRLLACHTHLSQAALRVSQLKEGDLAIIRGQIEFWKDKHFFLDCTPGNSVENIRAQVLLLKRLTGCDQAIIDHLHQMEGHPRRGETMDQVVGRNVRKLKQLALEAGCTVVLLSQMNRHSENRSDKKHEPQLSDLRDSGVIEQTADNVLFVYRPDRHGVLQDENGHSFRDICQLHLCKNRHGLTGKVNLRRNPSFTKFTTDQPTTQSTPQPPKGGANDPDLFTGEDYR